MKIGRSIDTMRVSGDRARITHNYTNSKVRVAELTSYNGDNTTIYKRKELVIKEPSSIPNITPQQIEEIRQIVPKYQGPFFNVFEIIGKFVNEKLNLDEEPVNPIGEKIDEINIWGVNQLKYLKKEVNPDNELCYASFSYEPPLELKEDGKFIVPSGCKVTYSGIHEPEDYEILALATRAEKTLEAIKQEQGNDVNPHEITYLENLAALSRMNDKTTQQGLEKLRLIWRLQNRSFWEKLVDLLKF
ncbi:MAG: hypothetical protein QNJ31_08905 [Candidatus Caenarcaniphilales bacterium]|nr:hypothetical protein [Candidatus Caenarcaniphilales bacterium]